jgi:ribosomal protein S18 acetylase RimI-like enzyme
MPMTPQESTKESSPGLTIREAAGADLLQIVRLLAAHLSDNSITPSTAAIQRAAQRLIEDREAGRILIASDDAGIAGIAVMSFLWTLEHGGAAAWLDELYVDPQRRRAGIGRRLTEAAMAVARARGCLALDLEVEPGHDDAERLYANMGFQRHRRVRWVRLL